MLQVCSGAAENTAQKAKPLANLTTGDDSRARVANGARTRDLQILPLRCSYTGWRKQWHALGRRAGVETLGRGLQAIRRTGATLSMRAGYSATAYLGHSPRSGQDVAARYYLDPLLLDEAPPLPPRI